VLKLIVVFQLLCPGLVFNQGPCNNGGNAQYYALKERAPARKINFSIGPQ
jgi:hypothetical protein